jgi:hypothetical protein
MTNTPTPIAVQTARRFAPLLVGGCFDERRRFMTDGFQHVHRYPLNDLHPTTPEISTLTPMFGFSVTAGDGSDPLLIAGSR